MIPERAWHQLHDGLKGAIGDENAGTLMEMLPAFPWHEIATRKDIEALRNELTTMIDGKIDSIFGRIVAVNIATMFGLAFAVASLVLAVLKFA